VQVRVGIERSFSVKKSVYFCVVNLEKLVVLKAEVPRFDSWQVETLQLNCTSSKMRECTAQSQWFCSRRQKGTER
jgi:hypothetical protein